MTVLVDHFVLATTDALTNDPQFSTRIRNEEIASTSCSRIQRCLWICQKFYSDIKMRSTTVSEKLHVSGGDRDAVGSKIISLHLK